VQNTIKKLTAAQVNDPLARPRWCLTAWSMFQMTTGLLIYAASCGAQISVPGWHEPSSIRAAAEQYALAQFGGQASASVESVGIDERLKLPQCSGSLDVRAHQPFRNGRGTVAVSCRGPSKWQLFVPIRVANSINVVVADKPIRANAIISADALRIERRSSNTLPQQFATRIDEVVGLTARRGIGVGAIVEAGLLDATKAIERGAIVTLTTARSGIIVRAEGIALEDGALGQRIRLRTPAGRVVEGIVTSDSEVRVGG
jgi:flagella basal body P-ring formation protein FlgA